MPQFLCFLSYTTLNLVSNIENSQIIRLSAYFWRSLWHHSGSINYANRWHLINICHCCTFFFPCCNSISILAISVSVSEFRFLFLFWFRVHCCVWAKLSTYILAIFVDYAHEAIQTHRTQPLNPLQQASNTSNWFNPLSFEAWPPHLA